MNADKTVKITSTNIFVRDPFKAYVGDDGIYVPHYIDSTYGMMLISKDLFVEAYNKWIRNEHHKICLDFCGEDTADDWSE